PAPQSDEQRQGVQGGTQADGQGQAGGGQCGHQGQIHQLGGHEHHAGDFYGCADILLRVGTGGEDFDSQDADQSGGIADDSQAGLGHVAGVEGAIMEQRGHEAVRQQSQADGGRQAQQQYQPQAPVEQ